MPLTPMLTVRDVEATSSWLRSIFPLTSKHGGPEFEMLGDAGEQIVMWLHRHEADHDHASIPRTMDGVGSGAIYYILVKDIEQVRTKAQEAGAEIVEDLHFNPLAHHDEFTVKSLDGYFFAAHTAYDPTRKPA